MRRKLMIPCPQCEGGDSKYFYDTKLATCTYCGGVKKIDIFEHFRVIGVEDERRDNVRSFVNDPRFTEYLEAKSKK